MVRLHTLLQHTEDLHRTDRRSSERERAAAGVAALQKMLNGDTTVEESHQSQPDKASVIHVASGAAHHASHGDTFEDKTGGSAPRRYGF